MATGVHLLMQNRVGSPSASYNAVNDGAIVIKDTGFTGLTASSNTDVDTDGYWYDAAAYASFASWTTLSAYTTAKRQYEVWGKTKDATPTNAMGITIVFNQQDANNKWVSSLAYENASNRIYVDLYKGIAGVYTLLGVSYFTVNVNWPSMFHFSVLEQGDSVICSAAMYETDSYVDDEVITVGYNVAARPLKSYTGGSFILANTPNDEWKIRGCRVMDSN